MPREKRITRPARRATSTVPAQPKRRHDVKHQQDGSRKVRVTSSRSKRVPRAQGQVVATQSPQSNKPSTDGGPVFPIVGIGASAGGLEAFTELLQALPANTGMAFVLIQHLDPAHESILTKLLTKATPMPVQQVQDGMPVEPNHVYVIPPNTNMAILHGRLSLLPRTEIHGQHLAIDHFFRSLADDQQSRAIGVVLSGTASDGTLGLAAIKAAGGVTFAQDSDSAKFDGMPRSAITTGSVDYVLPPRRIAAELARIGQHPYLRTVSIASTEELPPGAENDLAKIFLMLRTATGIDFTYYKRTTIQRRIARRMLLHQIDNLGRYLRYLEQNRDEVDKLCQDLLIHVTSFFRDPAAFYALKNTVFPRLIQHHSPETPLRIWVPGCSTGEEAYSIAICLLETFENPPARVPVQIFGTDVEEIIIAQARAGSYPGNIALDVSPERLRRFFVKTDQGYQVSKTVRDMCVFAHQDVTRDPPFSRVDVISCRNLLIYLTPELQRKVIPAFHYALQPDGFLLLGTSETIGGFADLFRLVDKKAKLYAKKSNYRRMPLDVNHSDHREERVDGAKSRPEPSASNWDPLKEADRVVLSKYGPPGVLVNADLEILQYRGHTGAYLEAPSGAPSLNVLKLAREGLLLELRSSLLKAKKSQLPQRRTDLAVQANGQTRNVNLQVIPVKPLDDTRGPCFLILFEEAVREPEAATSPTSLSKHSSRSRKLPNVSPSEERRSEHLRQELAATRGYLESLIEEHSKANEDLRAANEEIQSANEELQSTNEELETTKEELQSINEELMTVNQELQNRNRELDQINDDQDNLLGSLQIAVAMVGNDLRIRRATPIAKQVMNLLPTDVGRPLGDLRLNLNVPDLSARIGQVIDTLSSQEFETQSHTGKWYLIRLQPYKTRDHKIDGAVMSVVDIDALKRSQEQIHQAQTYAEAIVETVREPLLVLSADLRVRTANQAFYRMFRTAPAETENQFIYSLADGAWDISKLRELLENILPQNTRFENFHVDAEFPGVGRKHMVLNARRIHREDQATQLILLAIEEDCKQAE